MEIADVHHSIRTGLDPEGHGWATGPWKAGLEAALDEAVAAGVTVDVTAGPSWPAAVPAITPDSPSAIKELAHGLAILTGGVSFEGPVPAPVTAAAPGVTESKLIRVQAVRRTAVSTRESTPGSGERALSI